jgi:hypothetical protein
MDRQVAQERRDPNAIDGRPPLLPRSSPLQLALTPKRNSNVLPASILAAAVLIAAALISATVGRYIVVPNPIGSLPGVIIVDRFTGTVRQCDDASGCRVLRNQQ